MQMQKLKKTDIARLALRSVALLFCLVSLVWALIKQDSGDIFMSAISVLYVFIPDIAEKLFKFRIQFSLYVFIIFYTICPLLGYMYNFYYLVPWWDSMMHGFAGLVFAMLGAYLPYVLGKKKRCSVALCAFCAFFFSVAISGLWELVEFTSDSLFGTDMQKDTILYSLRPSYVISEMLGLPVGQLGNVDDVQIIINGQVFDYYVDLGLLDTMKDVLVETMGAAIYTIIYVAAKGKHFVFLPNEETAPLLAQVPNEPIAAEETEESDEEAAFADDSNDDNDADEPQV